MPTDPFAIPQVQTNALQRVGPVLNPMQGLREIVSAYAAIARMNRMASGGGRSGGGGTGGVGNPSKGRWVKLPDGQTVWVMGTTQKERDSEEAKIKAEYARGVLAKDKTYQDLINGTDKTPSFERLSVPGKRERMQQVREHMEAIAPTLGMDPQQSVMLGTAGMRENIAAREKAIKDTSTLDTLWDSVRRGFTDLGRAISTIRATPQEKQAAARASNEAAQEAAANNAYLDEMNRRREEGRSTLGMALRPTGLSITFGESLAGLGGTLAAQGLSGLAGGALGAFMAGPAGAAAGANLGRTIGQFAGAAAGGALAAGPLSEYSNVRRIEGSNLSDTEKLEAIDKSNAGWYGAAVGAIPLGPASGTAMALRQIPRTAPYVGRLSRMAAPAQTYTGGVIKGLAPNAIDAATLGAGFNVAGNYAYNQATGQTIPLTEGLGDAIMEGAIIGLPMAFLGARGSAARRQVWEANQTAREQRPQLLEGMNQFNNARNEYNTTLDNSWRDYNADIENRYYNELLGNTYREARNAYNNSLNAPFRQRLYGNARRAYNSDDAYLDAVGRVRGERKVSDELDVLYGEVEVPNKNMGYKPDFDNQLYKTLSYVSPENRDVFLSNLARDKRLNKRQWDWVSAFRQKILDPNEPKPAYVRPFIEEPTIRGPQNFGPRIEDKFTNSEINTLRKITKDSATFQRKLQELIATKPEGGADTLFTQLEDSSRLTGKQKQWVNNYRRIHNEARNTESSRSEQTARLGGDEQLREGEANITDTNTNRTAAADTPPVAPAATNESPTGPAEGGGTVEAGGNVGTTTPNPRSVETIERIINEQKPAGAETANGEPSAGSPTDVSTESSEGAGSNKSETGAGDGGITDAANTGKQSIEWEDPINDTVDNLIGQTENLTDTPSTFTADKAMEVLNNLYESGHKNMSRPDYTKTPEAAWGQVVSIASKVATGKKLSPNEKQQYDALEKAGMKWEDVIPPAEVKSAEETVNKVNDIGMNVNNTEMVEARENRPENMKDNLENPNREICGQGL
ncbi:MAG: hypothetical protein HDQ88_09445 [Clostridia bacterium]|nr:hypothetical protein [Clostridia bacterium]